jgi:hypothetical protein
MSLWSRIVNVVRGDRLSRDIDEELRSHQEEAIEQGRDPARNAAISASSDGSIRSARTSSSDGAS